MTEIEQYEHYHEYYVNNRERIIARQKAYYQAHKEECKAYWQRYYEENKEFILAKQHLAYQERKKLNAGKPKKEKPPEPVVLYRRKNYEKHCELEKEKSRKRK